MNAWVGQTARDLAAAVRKGSTTPELIVRDHLHYIDHLDGSVGAFVRVRGEEAIAEAAALGLRPGLPSLPLAGVPVAVKDIVGVRGEPVRFGSVATPDMPAAEDHVVVGRLRAAGAVIVGVTRTCELAVWGDNVDAWGVTRNPWDFTRSPGGSSAGSAAAVASAMVPVAHGADGGGSIRVPAGCCGLVGIKPGPGVVPPDPATGWRGLSEHGVLATTVDDAALLLSVMAETPSLATVAAAPASLRIAVSAKAPIATVEVDPQIRAALDRTASIINDVGHQVSTADPPYTAGASAAYVARWAAAVADTTTSLDAGFLEPRVRRHARLGRTLDRLRLVRQAGQDRWKTRMGEFFSGYDLLLTPTTATTPSLVTGWRDRSWLANFRRLARWTPFTAAWNFAQCPALVVPAAIHTTGTPISVQLIAPPGGEPLLLAVAKQLETLQPWPRHAPIARIGEEQHHGPMGAGSNLQ